MARARGSPLARASRNARRANRNQLGTLGSEKGCFLVWLPFIAFAAVVWIICAGSGANPFFVGAFLLALIVVGNLAKH